MDNYVTRVKRFAFDEEEVRTAFLSGLTSTEICARHSNNEPAVLIYITENKQRWLDEARFERIVSDDRRIVLPYLITNQSGHSYVMPISLPRNTFHLKQLAEEAEARGL